MTLIKLNGDLTPEQEQWILHNVGPRMFYLHNSLGGEGWILKRNYKNHSWELAFKDEKDAIMFNLRWL
jgi:hypothetical protein